VSILNAFRSEWILLNRKRLWLVLGAITTVYTIVATTLVISTAEPLLQQSEDGLSLEALVGAGGATMAVIFSIAFAFLLVVVMFASSTGNEFTRGTLRTALTFHSNRLSLMAGKLTARALVVAIVMAGALVIGSITAAIVAPAQDIGTDGWFGLAALGEAVEDYLRAIVFVVGFAVIGTTIAVLLRSTPIALGVGLLWFGPIENVIGEGRDWAERWFPGMVIRSIVRPEAPGAVATPAALATLGAYTAVCAAIIAVVMSRRDVTG
jgi:ABC-2 type transport system permease protein